MRVQTLLFVSASTMLAGLSVAPARGAVIYSLLDLGDLPGGLNASSGTAINELGDVAGTSNYTGLFLAAGRRRRDSARA
jgi:hypothetical protein